MMQPFRWFLTAVVALAAWSAPVAAFDVDDMKAPYTVTKNANLRAGPSTDFAKIGLLAAGTEITVTGKARDANWYRVARPDDTVAFIYGTLVRPAGTAARAAKPKAAPRRQAAVRVTPRREEMWAMRDTVVYARPDTASAVTGTIYYQAMVNITGKVPGTGWYRVRGAKGTAGFVRNPDFRPRTAGFLP